MAQSIEMGGLLEFDYESVPFGRRTPSARHQNYSNWNNEIRLLSFPYHTGPDEPLRCNLEVFDLRHAPKFAAVSYTWGDELDKFPVLANDEKHYVSVTENLHNILTRFALDKYTNIPSKWTQITAETSPWRLRWLWVDAICINQADTKEKSSQVRLMPDIYETAEFTFIWLGTHRNNYWVATLVQHLGACRDKYLAACDIRKWSDLSYLDILSYLVPNLFMPLYRNYDSFLTQGWFTRMWIVQELAVSKAPVVFFDRDAVSWEAFRDVWAFAVGLQLPMPGFKGILRVNELDRLRERAKRRLPQSLLSLLILSRGFKCKDGRDKIFALLGLATDYEGDELDIEPDYDMDLRDLYYTVAKKLLLQSGHLDLLGVPQLSNGIGDEPYSDEAHHQAASARWDRPSWVPDWRADDRQTVAFFSAGNHWDKVYTQFKAAPPHRLVADDFSADGRLLRLVGYSLDVLEEVGRELDRTSSSTRSSLSRSLLQGLHSELPTLVQWEDICQVRSRDRYETTGELIQDAYWQTMIAGQRTIFGWNQPEILSFDLLKRCYQTWNRYFLQSFRKAQELSSWPILRLFNPVLMIFLWAIGSFYIGKQVPIEVARFRTALINADGRRIFRSRWQHIGLAPAAAQNGDHVFLIKGCRTPIILRWNQAKQHWTMIGDCYMHGFMMGDRFDEAACESFWLA